MDSPNMKAASIPAKTSTSRHRRHRAREGERSERSSTKRSSTKRSNKEDSVKTKSNQSSSQYIRECACQRGLSCIGMTQAFRLLGDPRCYYVELPRYRKDPPAYKYVFRNNLRAAYIRHLAVQNPSIPDLPQILAQTQDRRYVALHHFHPRIIQAFYTNPLTKGTALKHKVPISITEFELTELGLEVHPEDRILSLTGKPTGGYYFCPGYSQEQAHEDLKALIKKERGLREAVEKEQNDVSTVPVNIEIRSKVAVEAAETRNAESVDAVGTTTTRSNESGNEKPWLRSEPAVIGSAAVVPADDDQDATVNEVKKEDEFINVTGAQDLEFDSLWADDSRGNLASPTHRPSIVYEESASDLAVFEGEENSHEYLASLDKVKVEQSGTELPTIPSVNRASSRDMHHPWQTPRYRRLKDGPEETVKRVSASPAVFIDPTVQSPVKPKKILDDDGESKTLPVVDKSVSLDRIAAAQKSTTAVSAAALQGMKSLDDATSSPMPKESASAPKKRDPPAYSPSIFTMDESELNSKQTHAPITQTKSQDSTDSTRRIHQSISHDSTDSPLSSGLVLRQKMPGFDPTMRIQVHNSLIAWESKRRTEMSERLAKYIAWWGELKSVVEHGMDEVDFAERFVTGFSKAGILFADVTQAVCDDVLLDGEEANAFSSSIIPNRIQKKWNTQESHVESTDPSSDFGQSTLLSSILATQLDLAQNFRETSSHIDEEITPELQDLRLTISTLVKDYEQLGDGIISELRQSETELKNIWDVFDAMVTGDLMEYTAHGSLHDGQQIGHQGGSQHGSQHSGSLHAYGSPSRTGHLEGVGEGPIISSMQAPGVKSTFRQLGSVEDGWLVEMYYRCAVLYQQDVFAAAEDELTNMTRRIADLEENRFGRLHELLLSFVPRQRRLFSALPEQFKGVLDDLVGLRIDEDTLQTLMDEMIKERSYDHLKRGASHRSSIMNRSRLNTDNEETEVEKIESRFGDPFKSPMIVLSKVAGLQIRGLVNASWKEVLVVVTLEGNLVVLTLPDDFKIGSTPKEAFQSLHPAQVFGAVEKWTRSNEIAKNLTPTLVLSLTHCRFSIPNKNQANQLQIVEEARGTDNGTGTGRLMRAVRAAADSPFSKKCTLRLLSASETTDWLQLLERTKKVMASRESNNHNKTMSPKKRFAF